MWLFELKLETTWMSWEFCPESLIFKKITFHYIQN